jgi:hypothetical protein
MCQLIGDTFVFADMNSLVVAVKGLKLVTDVFLLQTLSVVMLDFLVFPILDVLLDQIVYAFTYFVVGLPVGVFSVKR